MGLEALKAYSNAQKKQVKSKPKAESKPKNVILTAQMDRERKSQEIYKKIADNIKESEMIRRKINKDIKQGEDLLTLLDDCIKCISLMTGDNTFYKQNMKLLKGREL